MKLASLVSSLDSFTLTPFHQSGSNVPNGPQEKDKLKALALTQSPMPLTVLWASNSHEETPFTQPQHECPGQLAADSS